VALAFDETEAERLRVRVELGRAAGEPLDLLSRAGLARREPQLSERIVLASHCPDEGYVDAALVRRLYRERLAEAGIPYLERHPLTRLERSAGGFSAAAGAASFAARRLLLSCGDGLKAAAALLGAELPLESCVHGVSLTERCPRLLGGVVAHLGGRVSLLQRPDGTVRIGGREPGAAAPDPMQAAGPLRLALATVPALAGARLVGRWSDLAVRAPDGAPLAGRLPGVPDAFVLGCVPGGYAAVPCLARGLAALVAGREPELPLFDPGRAFAAR
jgi:glycine/D-amino acid oxidase-like deaminating enzyme